MTIEELKAYARGLRDGAGYIKDPRKQLELLMAKIEETETAPAVLPPPYVLIEKTSPPPIYVPPYTPHITWSDGIGTSDCFTVATNWPSVTNIPNTNGWAEEDGNLIS